MPMKTWRLILVDPTGRVLSSKRALARYLVAWIGPLAGAAVYAGVGPGGWLLVVVNYAWALADPDRQFLHDRVAGTRLCMEAARA